MADKSFSLFGFKLKRKEEEKVDQIPSFTVPANEDGATTISSSAFYSQTIDLDGITKNEVELITRYREMAMQPEIESAIEDIINEAIVQNDDGKTVDIVTDNIMKMSDKLRDAIESEFKVVLKLLNYNNMASDIFRRYYVDGRLFYHAIIDITNPKKGIQELRYVDPRKIRKIREVKKQKDKDTGVEFVTDVSEYYIYNDRMVSGTTATSSVQGIKIAPDSVINITSGLMDARRAVVLSYLHKAIKPLNQLRMIEDASVIYKLSRAPSRRIFYVDVGDMPKAKAEQYLRDMMTKYRNKLVYDANTGEVRDDRKHLCLSMDTKVPLLDGRTLTLSEISEEYKKKQIWAYSCDPNTGKFAPGLITWAGVSVKDAEIIRITLDNGKTIDCTPEHKFPVWENGLTMAKNLKEGDSLIPLYRKSEGITPGAKKNKDYEQIWENDKKKWSFTHREVSYWKDENNLENEFLFNKDFIGEEKSTIHHKNINRFDNSPNNLVRMNSVDHILFHRNSGSGSGKIGGKRCFELGQGFHNKNHPNYLEWHVNAGKVGGKISSENGKSQENFAKGREVFSNLISNQEYYGLWVDSLVKGWTEEKKEIASRHAKSNKLSERGNAAQKEQWKTPDRKKFHNDLYATEYTVEMFEAVKKLISSKTSKDKIAETLNCSSELLSSLSKVNENKCINHSQKSFDKFSKYDIDRIIRKFAGLSFAELKQQIQFRNHKIAKIEYLNEKMDAGCLTIDGEEKYHNYHTFALDAGIYTQNSMLEDFWMPRRNNGTTTEIKTLESLDNFSNMDMVEYFERKLYKSLNVPVNRLDPQNVYNVGRSSEITRDELKFAKFIDKLRNKFSDMFDQIMRIQLVLKGVCTEEEWEEYKEGIFYDFVKDNNYSELKEAELMQGRLGILGIIDPYVGKYYSKEWIQRNVLRLNDDEIRHMKKDMEKEKSDDLKNQEEDQGNQIKLQAQAMELQSKLMPQQEQQIDAGQEPEQSAGNTQQPNPNNPYNVYK